MPKQIYQKGKMGYMVQGASCNVNLDPLSTQKQGTHIHIINTYAYAYD